MSWLLRSRGGSLDRRRQHDSPAAAVFTDPRATPQPAADVKKHFPFSRALLSIECLQCFDAVGWSAGRASGL